MSQAEKDALEARLRAQIEAYHEAALVYAAVQLGLADKMEARRWTGEGLATALGLSAAHLARFLRGLCIIGVCEESSDGSFALTPFGRSLTSGSPLANKVHIVIEQYWLPWANLIATLPAGRPAFDQVFGMSVFDWRREHAAQGAMFAAYLAKETQADTEAILAALDVSETDKVVEIVGAHAAFLAEIPSGADLYLLKGVLQNYADDDAAVILKHCRAAMAEGARLVVAERLLPARAMDDPAAVMLDLHMMTITGGRARTVAEFEALLPQAGLALMKIVPTTSGLALMEANTEKR
jgi:O-methyltransferase domain